MALLATALRWSLRANSSNPTSITLLRLATPTRLQNSRMLSGEYPRRRKPLNVGMRGSSHPSTTPSSTKRNNLRLDMMVWFKFNRANSRCFDGKMPKCSMYQS